MKQYFLNFPTVSYGGYAATNIMERVAFAKKFEKNYALFYDYVVQDGRKAEHLANDLYGDSNYVWVIYLFNQIVDPYYQWPLSVVDFEQFILNKYGDFDKALTVIEYYQNNWYSDPRQLDVSGYNALPASLKKYWKPSILPGNMVSYYIRAQMDTKVNYQTYNYGGLPDDEIVYFSPVSAYDWELQQNNAKANIKLLKPNYLASVEASFKQVLS